MELSIDDGVAILRLQAGKGNAMTDAMLEALDGLLARLEASGARAAVITGQERFFSGGLALPSLYALDRAGMSRFIRRFGEIMARVYRCPLPVVSAINGHAIAGGCVLAIQTDWRIAAAGDYKIGLNEVQLGIGLPPGVLEPLRAQVPPASMVPIALEGRLFGPHDALAVGLVHEVVAPEGLEVRAMARARELAQVPSSGFSQVKAALHRPALEAVERVGDAETERWLDSWFSDAARARIGEAVKRLTQR